MVKWIIIILLAVVVVVGIYLWSAYTFPVDIGERVVSVIIESGDDFPAVAAQLIDAGFIRSQTVFKYAAQWRGIDRKLVPGRYDFSGAVSCSSILDKLEKADFVNIKVTVYEGAPIWKVASILAERMEIDSTEIIALNTDSLFLDSLGLPYLEGYLFPETYFFPWRTGVRKIVREMVVMYNKQTTDVWPDTICNGLSREEIIILASIVEAEALLDEEKSRIASVYQNRIKRGMKLDADPTVIYGLGGLDRPLKRRDLQKKTPYNTYRTRNLPPTPINSPGLAAIKAALHPEETDFLYFVADGNGQHRFSCTNAEHNRARRQIKRQ